MTPGAGNGIRVRLAQLFNDNSEEAKLLALQLQLLKNHLEENLSSKLSLFDSL